MWYYTTFNFKIKTPVTRERAEQIVNCLNNSVGWTAFKLYVLDFTLMNEEREDWEIEVFDEKWYNWEEIMTSLARENPDVEFYLEGNGEDKDDWWVALFKGKRKQIKYCSPPSDEWED